MPPILETPLTDTVTSFKIIVDAPLNSGGTTVSIQPIVIPETPVD